MDKLGLRIRDLRQQAQMSQKDLAKYLGVGRTSITTYENGSNIPPIEKISMMAKIFNVSTDYLLGKSSYKNYQQAQDSWKRMDKQRYDQHDIITSIDNLIEQINLDEEITNNGTPLSEKESELAIKHLELLKDMLK